MSDAPRGPNPLTVLLACIGLLPGIACLIAYAFDPGMREWLGWHAVWLFLWCAVCFFFLARALKRRYDTLGAPPYPDGYDR